MQTQPLLYGLIGFVIGGLLVSVAATTFDKPTMVMDGMPMSTADMRSVTGDDYDKAFLTSMIAHHEQALDMAQEARNNAKHDEIKRLSNGIITAQQREINQMRSWQQAWGY